MNAITSDELRKRVEWARNNRKASPAEGGQLRFEHEGRCYLIPAEILVQGASAQDAEVDLDQYLVS